MSSEVTVTDADDQQRFEARANGRLAGILTYTRTAGLVVYPHTKVQTEFEGKGVGGILARAALDDARERGLEVDPRCPFIAAWIDKHPDYRGLVVAVG